MFSVYKNSISKIVAERSCNLFENLTDKLSDAFRKLTGRGVLSEKDIKDAMRLVRRALLEADVSFSVAKEFTTSVGEKAVGSDILKSLKPGQQVIKIVSDELVALLGNSVSELNISGSPPIVYLLIGLQGSGKTTTAAGLAYWLAKNKGKRCLLTACDLQRPAAIDQLEILAGQAGAGFFCKRDTRNSAEVLEAAIKEAHLQQFDIVIADTAGRLHVDDDLMDELALIRDVGSPVETLLVLDGLSGQDAINVAVEFQKKIGYTGGIITKMDGDSRGGAALSFRAVTDKPVKFLGTGETVKGLERMDPQRLAGRILGMGDVLGLVEKAQGEWDIEEAAKLEKKIRSNSFTLDDFAGEIRKISKLGSLSDLMNMLPANMRPSGMNIDPSQLTRMEAIINSMTPRERVHPELINGSRRKRIARGSGTSVRDVNRLLSEFRTMKTMMKRIKGGKGMNFPGIFG